MKIAIINSDYTDYIEPFIKLMGSKYDLTYITINKSKSIKGIKTKQIKGFNFIVKGISIKLIRYLLKEKFDVVIGITPSLFYSTIAPIIQKRLHKKYILWNELWWKSKHWKFKLFFPIIKHNITIADQIIVPGTYQEEFSKQMGVSKEKITKGVFASKQIYTQKLYSKKINQIEEVINVKNKKRFLYFGRIVPYKGLDILIKAFAKAEKENNNIHLTVSGNYKDDTYMKYCVNLAYKLRVQNITFLGPNSPEWVPYLFNWADIAVFPVKYMPYNIVCGEAWGLVVNEAMSAGCFVIGTDAIAAAKDIITPQTGLFIKNNNENELKKAILQAAKTKINKKEIQKIIDKKYNYDEMFIGFKKAIELSLKVNK